MRFAQQMLDSSRHTRHLSTLLSKLRGTPGYRRSTYFSLKVGWKDILRLRSLSKEVEDPGTAIKFHTPSCHRAKRTALHAHSSASHPPRQHCRNLCVLL